MTETLVLIITVLQLLVAGPNTTQEQAQAAYACIAELEQIVDHPGEPQSQLKGQNKRVIYY